MQAAIFAFQPAVLNIIENTANTTLFTLFCLFFEVTFSQCLGVIGYSVLPLIVTALALIAFHSVPALNTMIKVCEKDIFI